MTNAITYSARILFNGKFYGYLSVKDRAEWKTKYVCQRHAKEFCQTQGEGFTFEIEEN